MAGGTEWDGEQGIAWVRGQEDGRIHSGSWAVVPQSSTMQSTLPRLPTAGSRPSVLAPWVAPVLATACHRGHRAPQQRGLWRQPGV